MAQLGHKGVGEGGNEHGDDGTLPPFGPGLYPLRAVRKTLAEGGEEGHPEQKLHERQGGGDSAQHCQEYQPLLGQEYMVCRGQGGLDADGLGQPVDGGGHAMAVVGGEAVVGVQ